jgi:hypothetical protein
MPAMRPLSHRSSKEARPINTPPASAIAAPEFYPLKLLRGAIEQIEIMGAVIALLAGYRAALLGLFPFVPHFAQQPAEFFTHRSWSVLRTRSDLKQPGKPTTKPRSEKAVAAEEIARLGLTTTSVRLRFEAREGSKEFH